MAFLDFIKNRDGQRPPAEQQSQQQKPEVTRDASPQQGPQDSAAARTVGQLPEDVRSRAKDIGERIAQTAESVSQNAPPVSQTPQDATGSQQPQRQKMTGQDNAAPDLTPTSAQAGIPAKDLEGPGPPETMPSKSQTQSQEQARQTIARRPPSWER